MRKAAAFVLAAAVLLSAINIRFQAGASEITNDNTVLVQNGSSYENYIAEHSDANKPSDTILLALDNCSAVGTGICEISTSAETIGNLFWQGEADVSWNIEVKETGLYCFKMSYFSQSKKNSYVSFGISVDDEFPFDEAREIKFDRYWKNKHSIRLDSEHKNQILPEIEQYNCTINAFAKSSEISDEPLYFYLSQGTHKLTLHGVNTDLYISSLKFSNNAAPKSYIEIYPSRETLEGISPLIDGKTIRVEAEMPEYTNSAALRPTSDRTDYTVSPSHPVYTRYNTIGADSWNTAGQKLFYEVTVPESGYYALNIKCRLKTGSGLSANRRISVNGAVPCKELNNIEIAYSADWQTFSPSTEGGRTIFVNLKAGKNIIAFEAINGETGEALRKLNNVICELSDSVGSTEINEKFGEFAEEISAAKSRIEAASGRKINASEIDILVNLLRKYENKAPENFSDLKKSLKSVFDWIKINNNRSVEMDYFELRTVHENFSEISRNFFKQMAFGFQRFFGSFFENFTTVSENNSGTEILVASGKNDAQLISSLVSGEYPEEVSVTIGSGGSGSLLEMALAGKTPDVALLVDEEEVYELARRGLIVNLAGFPDYADVENRSPAGVSKLFEYNGGKYGIPLTNSYPMMFYREDILEELGLSVPESWDDLTEMLPVLNEKGLTVGLGSPSDFSAGNAFMLMMSQSGQSFGGSELNLNEDYAKEAFARYVDFYDKYGCPQDYNAVRMFKSGKMPIVIADYAEFYGELSSASDLRWRWKIAHVPGTRRTDENGNAILDFSVNSNSHCAVIFADCKDISKAWEFVSWFSQPEIQTEFGVIHEASTSEKYFPANLTSVYDFSTSEINYDRLRLQASRINEIPKSAMTASRRLGIYEAFLESQKSNRSPKELIAEYGRAISEEAARNKK